MRCQRGATFPILAGAQHPQQRWLGWFANTVATTFAFWFARSLDEDGPFLNPLWSNSLPFTAQATGWRAHVQFCVPTAAPSPHSPPAGVEYHHPS